jgi:hypothetical protein
MKSNQKKFIFESNDNSFVDFLKWVFYDISSKANSKEVHKSLRKKLKESY